jgi:predicted Rossmann fold flavoprotein
MRLAVIGGGAAGFFCAVNAARLNPSLEVVIVEKGSKLLTKVRVSGGGRCNVTHACFSISEMTKKYPRGSNFLKKAFHHFFTPDTINWFDERGVTLKTEQDNRMFPTSDTSQTIIDCLMSEANKYGVEVLLNAEVKEMSRADGKRSGWLVQLNNNRLLTFDFVCIASGGYPKSSQFDWLKKTGHTIIDPLPSLFTFNMPGNHITSLMGVTASDITVKVTGTKFTARGSLLITHWGLSGPAILTLSALAARELAKMNYEFIISVNWLSLYNEQTLKEKILQIRFDIAAQKMINKNPFGLAQRLWQYILQQSGISEDIRWADLPSKEQNKLVRNLCAQDFSVKGKTTFKDEFVTAGGVSTDEIDYNTMESRIIPGLYFAGEVLDIDGVTGGFNFQNAWTTGFIAAKAISSYIQ